MFPNIEDFVITPKADGIRCLAMITNNECKIIDSKSQFVVNLHNDDEGVTIVDAELMGTKKKPQIMPFDVVVYGDQNMRQLGFETRREKLSDVRTLLGNYAGPKKPFKRLTKSNYGKVLKKVFEKKWKFPIDGAILVEAKKHEDTSYVNTTAYKIKPNPTIDFLVMKVPATLYGKSPYLIRKGMTPYILFCGVNYTRFRDMGMTFIPGYNKIFPKTSRRDKYFPIQFSPPDFRRAYIYYHNEEEDIHGKVVEFTYSIPEGKTVIDGFWVIEKIRNDRQVEVERGGYFGNDFKVALTNWENLSNPITQEFLENPLQESYFKAQRKTEYIGFNSFCNYVKSVQIRHLRSMKWVVDLASGRGGDLLKYAHHNIKNVLFVEADKTAIQELQDRKRKAKMIKYQSFVLEADLNQPFIKTQRALKNFDLPSTGVDAAVCNFAIHYMTSTKKDMDNFIKLVSGIIKSGGRFSFTVLDGVRTHRLLERQKIGKDEKLDIFDSARGAESEGSESDDGALLKYSIHRKYGGKKFQRFKQKIGLVLPFTAGEYYEEILVDVEHLIQQFEKNGFARETIQVL